MALNRKFLNALGIETEKQDEIIDQHLATVNEIKDERDTANNEIAKLKKEVEELDTTKTKLAEAEKELNELKSGDPTGGFKEKYETLKTEYEQYKSDIETKTTKKKKEDIYKKYLKESDIPEKRFDAIIRLSGEDIDKIELDENGNEKDGEGIKKGILENWADYVSRSGRNGASTPHPPENNGNGGKEKSRAAEIAEKYHEELYGKIKED